MIDLSKAYAAAADLENRGCYTEAAKAYQTYEEIKAGAVDELRAASWAVVRLATATDITAEQTRALKRIIDALTNLDVVDTPEPPPTVQGIAEQMQERLDAEDPDVEEYSAAWWRHWVDEWAEQLFAIADTERGIIND